MPYIQTIQKLHKLARFSTTSSRARYGARVKQGEFAAEVIRELLSMVEGDRVYVEDIEAAMATANKDAESTADSLYSGRLGALPSIKRAIRSYNARNTGKRIKLVADDFIYWEEAK